MKVFIKELTFSGIKNIKDKLTISFGKKNVHSKEELNDANIKSVYGPNGAGKTAVLHALYIFKNLLSQQNYLNNFSNLKYLNDILNKESDSIDIKVEFYYFDKENKPLIYVYNVILKKESMFMITEEYYAYKRDEYAVEQVVFHSLNGEIKQSTFTDEIKQKTYNLLKERSFAQIINDYVLDSLDKNNDDSVLEDFKKVVPVVTITNHLLVVLDKEDALNYFPARSSYITNEQLKNLNKNLKNKIRFIKLFNHNIKSIELIPKLVNEDSNKSLYELKTILNYVSYKVNLEHETAGMKKLFKLYDYFKELNNGKIVVIDELDSHINDIFLTKMLEYTYEYAKGQLIFTSHSITPMETLRKGKNAIDFISISGKITSWKQIGNYSPTNLYKNGMIDGLPFNIWSESFDKIFSGEEH